MSTISAGAASHLDDQRWTPEELGTGPVSVEPCKSPEYFDRERETIFKHAWLNVGRMEEIPNPGDYFVRNISVVNASVIVARGQDGKVRAFHNVCSHRANKVAWDESGNCRRFTCNFHGWTFALDGELRGVPDESNFFDFEKKANGLTPVEFDEWEGFLFINLESPPRNKLVEYLGEFGKGIGGYPFRALTCYRYKVNIACNWKVAMNAFQESYHVPFVHQKTVPDSAAGPDNPFGHLVGASLFPLHSTVSLYANPRTRLNAVDEVVARYGAGFRKRVVTLTSLPDGVNPMKAKHWGFDINTVFPNFMMLLWGSGQFLTYNVWPISVNKTVFEIRLYNRKPETAGERFVHEYNRMVLRTAIAEDLATLEQVQPAVESGAKPSFLLQDNEVAIRHHYKMVDDYICARTS
jgi:phenylpropionate dioxygenase-like ring-hydroxylating dioxygenase large terminal subunit